MRRGRDERDADGDEGDKASFPTLGEVAAEEDFEPLQVIVAPVKNRPVNEFLLDDDEDAAAVRSSFSAKATNAGFGELWPLFVVACKAKKREVEEERKRRRVASRDSSGALVREELFFSSLFFFFVDLFIRSVNARVALRSSCKPPCCILHG